MIRIFAWEALRAASWRGGHRLPVRYQRRRFPQEAERIVREVVSRLFRAGGDHFHEDCGMATANSIVSVQAGASQVQGTLLGFGERCGNANLSSIIPDLQLKLGIPLHPQEELLHLTHRVRELAAIANVDVPVWMPYVGKTPLPTRLECMPPGC